LPAGLPAKFLLAVAAIILALLAMPQFGNAQGIVSLTSFREGPQDQARNLEIPGSR
jgi:hypothetical protein